MAQTLAQLIKGVNLASAPANSFTIDSSGRCGIGTTSPQRTLSVSKAGAEGIEWNPGQSSNVNTEVHYNRSGSAFCGISTQAAYHIFDLASSEAARIDSSGRLLVGTSTARTGYSGNTPEVQIEAAKASDSVRFGLCNNSNGVQDSQILLAKTRGTSVGSNTVVQDGDTLGRIQFLGADGTDLEAAAQILAQVDGTPGNNDMPGRLVFSTTADGASSPTERMRIDNIGRVKIKMGDYGDNTVYSNSVNGGVIIGATSGTLVQMAAVNDAALNINRLSSDGDLIQFNQAGTNEGSISVSGTTVSYNGAHLSRWSQLPSGAERTNILRGSVLANIDEMCEWGDEKNEQLNRMKVSDVQGDKNVSGVFQAWDDDDDTYTNDFYCAMTGDFIIRIAAGVTVERGDLLMSAGDGTAKPQDDDIIRSKTIAKVTSTNVSCTYDDGSYCVPCVLMAC